MKTLISSLTLALGMGVAIQAAADELSSLKNLERERSAMLSVALASNMTPAERQREVAAASRRLIDIERMAIRDDRLEGHRSPLVRACFDSYERCFLSHASAEAGQTVLETWLTQVGLTAQAIEAANYGHR